MRTSVNENCGQYKPKRCKGYAINYVRLFFYATSEPVSKLLVRWFDRNAFRLRSSPVRENPRPSGRGRGKRYEKDKILTGKPRLLRRGALKF